MFTYCFIDNYGIQTPADFAYDRDYDYLLSLVKKGDYKELKILHRIF